jgi:hypothetical protein
MFVPEGGGWCTSIRRSPPASARAFSTSVWRRLVTTGCRTWKGGCRIRDARRRRLARRDPERHHSAGNLQVQVAKIPLYCSEAFWRSVPTRPWYWRRHFQGFSCCKTAPTDIVASSLESIVSEISLLCFLKTNPPDPAAPVGPQELASRYRSRTRPGCH